MFIYKIENINKNIKPSQLVDIIVEELELNILYIIYEREVETIHIHSDDELSSNDLTDIETIIENYTIDLSVEKVNVLKYEDDFSEKFNEPHVIVDKQYIDDKIPSNLFYIGNKQDFIDLSISYENNIITLPGNVTYFITNLINLEDDKIIVNSGESVAFRGSNNSIITATGLSNEDYMLTLENTTLVLSNIILSSNNSKSYYFDNPSQDYSLYSINCVFENGNFGNVLNARNFIISDSIHSNYNNLSIGNVKLGVIDNSLFEITDNLLKINGGIIEVFRISNSIIDADNNNSIFFLEDEDISNSKHIIIGLNQFLNFENYPILNSNAKNENLNIPSGSNIGLPGLFRESFTIVLNTYSTNSDTFGIVPQTFSIGAIDRYEIGAGNIIGNIRCTVSSTIDNGGIEVALYNRTDETIIEGSELSSTILSANAFQVEISDDFSIEPDKEYSILIRRIGSTQGNPESIIRSATLNIEVF